MVRHKRTRARQTITQAVVIDAVRRARKPKLGRHRKLHSSTPTMDKAAMKARRQRTAKALKKLSRTQPFSLASNHGTLLNHGYILKKGDGYVRSDVCLTSATGRGLSHRSVLLKPIKRLH